MNYHVLHFISNIHLEYQKIWCWREFASVMKHFFFISVSVSFENYRALHPAYRDEEEDEIDPDEIESGKSRWGTSQSFPSSFNLYCKTGYQYFPFLKETLLKKASLRYIRTDPHFKGIITREC